MLGQVVPITIPTPGRGPVPEVSPPIPLSLTTVRGYCRPFGATARDGGVNFAVFSRHAHSVPLVLFREGQPEPLAEIPLDPTINKTGDIWHILVHGLPEDVLYGYRMNGPFSPRQGHRFNPKAILLDPYARAVTGGHPWGTRPHTNG